MSEVWFPQAVPFSGAACDKAHALKVLEEAAELVEAVKSYARHRAEWERLKAGDYAVYDEPIGRGDVLAEAMDVYQALANVLADGFSEVEVQEAYRRCFQRNHERGRYA